MKERSEKKRTDQNGQIPSIEEQWEVANYVLYRPLPRPETNLLSALRFALPRTILPAALACLVTFLFWQNPSWMPIWLHEHIWVIWVLCFALFFLIACLFEARRVLVGLVRLYQHYAPEKIRRRCLCKPTCSEYAILVLEQEPNVFKALWRIYLRLHKTCKGGFYKIDLP